MAMTATEDNRKYLFDIQRARLRLIARFHPRRGDHAQIAAGEDFIEDARALERVIAEPALTRMTDKRDQCRTSA